jgi:hypothetical protein
MGQATEKLNPYLEGRVNKVFEMVEDISGITKTMLLSRNRKRHIVDARKIFVNILRRMVKLTGYQVAKEVNMDHTTIVHYEKMHNVHMTEPEYRRMYSAIAGMYAIQTSVEDEDSLREQFHELQGKTKVLLIALKGQCDVLNKISEEL